LPSLERPLASLLLFGIAASALAVRSLGAADVFLADDTVVLAVDDASYHARLAHYGASHFPRLLVVDPLLNHPDGARVPWPFLYDGFFAALGWLFAATPSALDRILAWASPVFGALTVFPVYLAARALVPRGVALAAAFFYAWLPVAVIYSRVGNPDHHAWMALLAACYLALSVSAERACARAPMIWTAGLVAVRLGVVLSWSGSLLYLVLGEGALALAALCARQRAALRLQAWGCVATAVLVATVVFLQPEPLAGWFSASALSGLHALFFLAVALVVACWLLFERVRPSSGSAVALARAALLGLAVGSLVALLPSVQEGVMPALSYMRASEGFIGNPEQFPLYRWMRSGVEHSLPGSFYYYAGFAALLPAAGIAALIGLRDPRTRSASLVLAVWSIALGVLAVMQLRWGNDFAPAAGVAFALAGWQVRQVVDRRAALWRIGLVLVCSALLLSPLVVHWPKLERALVAEDSRVRSGHRPPAVPMVRFVQQVGRAVHSASAQGRSTSDAILASPAYGHVLHHVAGLATPTDNFGPQFDPDRYQRVLRFFAERSNRRAMEQLRDFDVGWLMVDRSGAKRAKRMVSRLFAHDGSAHDGSRSIDRLRLAAEAEAGSATLGGDFGPGPPYKLFQWVEGASIMVDALPGTIVRAQLEVVTPWGRRFSWRTSERASATGLTALRVPYPTSDATGDAVHGAGPYRVTWQDREVRVEVSEAEVLSGAELRVVDAGATRD